LCFLTKNINFEFASFKVAQIASNFAIKMLSLAYSQLKRPSILLIENKGENAANEATISSFIPFNINFIEKRFD
jgi:hypothetical protein